MPFGLSCASWVFTKLMKLVVSFLRAQGLLSAIYPDDFLILGSSKLECRYNLTQIVEFLEKLGFVINFRKSPLLPSMC